ncbi:hypothetical protein IMZ48_00880 [Candidatus Bathyarchaeota archaeon]|nr:hypothetical protein [Candidatus Bathyarchaeota archaeon]
MADWVVERWPECVCPEQKESKVIKAVEDADEAVVRLPESDDESLV